MHQYIMGTYNKAPVTWSSLLQVWPNATFCLYAALHAFPNEGRALMALISVAFAPALSIAILGGGGSTCKARLACLPRRVTGRDWGPFECPETRIY